MSKQVPMVLFLVLCLGVSFSACAGDGKWGDDFAKAKAEAAEKGRPILIDFTGSDWCGWCIKLEKEVFSKTEFKKYARANLVLFVADFPQGKKVSKKTRQQNDELAKTYGVKGYPTVLLVDAEGTVIARTGYKEGGAEAYVKQLQEMLKDFKPAEDKDAKDK